MQISVQDARGVFSELIETVEAGETVEIARDGKPVARLVPVDRPRAPITEEDLRNWGAL